MHKFAITIEHHHYITKKKEEATSFVKVDKSADTPVQIIKELKDPKQNTLLYCKTLYRCYTKTNK